MMNVRRIATSNGVIRKTFHSCCSNRNSRHIVNGFDDSGKTPPYISQQDGHSKMITLPDTSLTTEEINFIESNPFLTSIEVPSNLTYLNEKVVALSRYIPIKDGYLSYKRPLNVPTPFEVLQLPQNDSSSRIPESDFPRLSVTKLLTDSWCELREFYDIYSRISKDETLAMSRGKEIHYDLEIDTHPIIDFSEELEGLPEFTKSNLEETCSSTVELVLKLINLFLNGHAREIYLHSFMNENQGVVNPGFIKSSDMLVTGIIDHLILQSSYRNDNPLNKSLDNVNDIDEIIKKVDNIVEDHGAKYRVLVSDVKTRSRRVKPSQSSVIEASKHQVMFYRKFLEVFGSSEFSAYEYLKEYYSRQKLTDLDKPLSPKFVMALICTNGGIFIQDFIKIAQGKPINIKQYDELNYNDTYDFSKYSDEITDLELLEKLEPFLIMWEKPLTLRYFLIRLSQLIHSISKLLADDLRIEYYCRDELFELVEFKYNEEKVQFLAKRSLNFWYGHRNPEPIEPSFKNISEKCKYCEYNNNCSWKFNFEKKNINSITI